LEISPLATINVRFEIPDRCLEPNSIISNRQIVIETDSCAHAIIPERCQFSYFSISTMYLRGQAITETCHGA